MDSKIDALKIELEAARANLKLAEEANELAECLLRDALPESKDASDYRIVVGGESWGWTTTAAMLDDVFGDCYTEEDGTLTEDAQRYVKAFEDAHGEGIAAYHARLEVLDEVTGEYIEEDACGGFFSCGYDGAPIDQIRDQLQPRGLDGDVEICEEI